MTDKEQREVTYELTKFSQGATDTSINFAVAAETFINDNALTLPISDVSLNENGSALVVNYVSPGVAIKLNSDLTYSAPVLNGYASDVSSFVVKTPMCMLMEKLKAEEDYAWSFHCNIAMPAMDNLNISHEEANRFAAKLMKHMFDVDTSEFKWFKDLENRWTESPSSITVSIDDENYEENLQEVIKAFQTNELHKTEIKPINVDAGLGDSLSKLVNQHLKL